MRLLFLLGCGLAVQGAVPEPRCPGNLELQCMAADNCVETCDKPMPDGCDLEICSVWICRCPDGKVLDTQRGRCVKPDKCPCPRPFVPVSGCHPKNYLEACQSTCETPDKICPALCEVSGPCGCPEGTVYDTDTNECVAVSECSKGQCPGNMVPACWPENADCVTKCSDDGPRFCAAVCEVEACTCPGSLVLDEDLGICIPAEQCQRAQGECPAPFVPVSGCHPANYLQTCQPSCDNPDPFCITLCEVSEPCGCPNGQLYRKDTGECVDPSQCPRDVIIEVPDVDPKCPKNLEPICVNAGDDCVTTCDDDKRKKCEAPADGTCPEVICGCPGKKVYNEAKGKCVKKRRCPDDDSDGSA